MFGLYVDVGDDGIMRATLRGAGVDMNVLLRIHLRGEGFLRPVRLGTGKLRGTGRATRGPVTGEHKGELDAAIR